MYPLRILLLLFLVGTSDVGAFPAVPLSDSWLPDPSVQRLAVTEDAISQFFWYYDEHYLELDEMPEFYEGEEPDWDWLTLFVWLCFWQDHPELAYGDGRISTAQFEETLRTYLPEVIYTHGSWGDFDYKNGYYMPGGFDTLEIINYYRLRALNKKADGVYQAAFDVLAINALEYGWVHRKDEPVVFEMNSPNMQMVYRYAKETWGWDLIEDHEDDWEQRFEQTIEAIFLREDYGDILEMSYQVVIEFRLSDDPLHPIQYLSCDRGSRYNKYWRGRGDNPYPTIPLENGADVSTLAVTEEATSQFFRYYNAHKLQLKEMPQFYEGRKPDRDLLTLFVWCCFWEDHPELAHSEKRISTAQFEETLRGYLPEVQYTHGKSAFLDYHNGYYTPGDFATADTNYYRLQALNKKANGVYQASFDVLTIEDGRVGADDFPNMQEIYRYAKKTWDWDAKDIEKNWPQRFEQTIEGLFLQENYRDILDLSGQAVIEFRLSDDKDYPIQYLSYKRTDSGSEREEGYWQYPLEENSEESGD